MKTLALTGAVLSFGCFTVPGLALIAHASGDTAMGANIIGSLLIGIGVFAGTLLWLMGEKLGPQSGGK